MVPVKNPRSKLGHSRGIPVAVFMKTSEFSENFKLADYGTGTTGTGTYKNKLHDIIISFSIL